VAMASGCFEQGVSDGLDGVCAPWQGRQGQQHVGPLALRADRTARTQCHVGPVALADEPGPGMAPGAKPPGALARQPASMQLGLGPVLVHREDHVCVLPSDQCDVHRPDGVGPTRVGDRRRQNASRQVE
jgi:hypothetical protein